MWCVLQHNKFVIIRYEQGSSEENKTYVVTESGCVTTTMVVQCKISSWQYSSIETGRDPDPYSHHKISKS